METIPNRLDIIWCQLAQVTPFREFVTNEDIKVYLRRARSEGNAFRTDGLAALGRTLLRGLREGVFTVEGQARFRPKVGSVLPLFLYGAWSIIFNDDGSLRCHAKTSGAVDCIRQLTAVYSKLPLPYPEDRVKAVQDRFIENERVMASFPEFIPDLKANVFNPPLGGLLHGEALLASMRKRISRVLCNQDPRDIIPRHGSGASACGTRPWERYGSFRYSAAIDKIWPYSDYFFSGAAALCDGYQVLSEMEDLPRQAKVVYVPKDYRGPRLISCEPREHTYIQQGLMTLLMSTLEQNVQTRGFVNFTDQSINQQLARIGSVYANRSELPGDSLVWGVKFVAAVSGSNRSLATLDLKDASDLLRWDLVKEVFPENWSDALEACRSTSTILPCGKVVELTKHAPMGSSVCFPVMALCIWSAIKAALPPRTQVWVYGDDVIVPSQFAETAIKALTAIGLMVNIDKSFAGPTPFRESCGGEYYEGSDVTPIKLGSDMSGNTESKANLASFVNLLTFKYGSIVTHGLVECISSMTKMPIIGMRQYEYMTNDLPWCKTSWETKGNDIPFAIIGPDWLCQKTTLRKRWNKDLQRSEIRLRKRSPVNVTVNADCWSYVLRFLLIGGDLGTTSTHALARRVRYKYSWVSLV